jgi:hypothetical protein
MIVTASTTSRLCISAHACGGKKGSSNQEKEKERTRSRTFKITNDVGHAGLVAEGSSKVHGLLRVILTAPQAPRWSVYAPHCSQRIGPTLGKDLTFPRWRAARFRGKKPSEPCRGASYCRSPSRCVEKKGWVEREIAAGEGRVERVTRKKVIFVSAALTCASQRDRLAVDAYLTVTANRNQRREADDCGEWKHTSLCLATPDGVEIFESGKAKRGMRKVEMYLVTVCRAEVAEPPAPDKAKK